MKFTVERENILKPLQYVVGTVERRQTLPILANILIVAENDELTVTGTDLEVELTANFEAEVSEPGKITVPARKLLDICKALPEGSKIDVAVNKERVTVKSGRSKFTLSSLPAEGFPSIEQSKTAKRFFIEKEDFKRLIEQSRFSMAQQDARYYLNGMMFELQKDKIKSVSTDGHRLSLCEMAVEIPDASLDQIIIPRKGIIELSRLLDSTNEKIQVNVATNHIHIVMPGIVFTSKLIDGKFPDYQRVVPENASLHVIADRENLKQSLIRTSILSNEKYRGVRLLFSENSIRIHSNNPEQEEAEDILEAEYCGEEIEIGFNVAYIIDALGAISGDTVKLSFSGPSSSCLIQEIKGGDSKYVIMPMRI